MARKVRQPLGREQSPTAATDTGKLTRYGMLIVGIVCQLATVIMTWQVWNVRTEPVNLPLIPVPALSMGAAIIASLLAALIWPRVGVVSHAALFALACLWDQYRLQPQVLSLIVLLLGCTFATGTWLARWYLAAMWLWAGLHKLFSAEWFGWQSWLFLDECGLPADGWHVFFAAFVAAGEIGLGLAAVLAPRRAAIGCLVLHLGILLVLSPLVRNFNPSVWPWNLATAVVGAWILRQNPRPPTGWWPQLVVTGLFCLPAGFYVDVVNPHLAFVLYSGNMPQALHISPDSIRRLDGWAGLAVPFPDSPRLLVEYFRRTAAIGDKLHVADPRPGLPDRYFVQSAAETVREVSLEQFLADKGRTDEVKGIELDDPSVIWRLERLGAKLSGAEDQMVVSATLSGPHFDSAALRLIAKLSNLRELRISSASIADDDLAALNSLARLEILEISHCPLTDAALQYVGRHDGLVWLHLEEIPISSAGMSSLERLTRLETLHLPYTAIDDSSLDQIGRYTELRWLDLAGTRITSNGLSRLASLANCEWLTLSNTETSDEGMAHLRVLTQLEVLECARTSISDQGLAHLTSLAHLEYLDLAETAVTDTGLADLQRLTNLKRLIIRDTQVTSAGSSRLHREIPRCSIEF